MPGFEIIDNKEWRESSAAQRTVKADELVTTVQDMLKAHTTTDTDS